MNKLLRQAISNSATVNPDPRTVLTRAIDLHRSGQLGEASTLYGKVLQHDPQNFDALHLLGVAALQTGNAQGAVTMIQLAVTVNPDSSDAWTNLCTAHLECGDIGSAVRSGERASEIEPSSAEVWFNFGNAVAALGDKPRAVTCYEEAVRLRPNYVQALTNLGSELIDAGRHDEARAALDAAIAENPEHAKAHLNLGVLYQELGQVDQAQASFDMAIDIDPNYGRAFANLSHLALEDGDLGRAAEFANRAYETSTPDIAAGVVGNVYRALGIPDAACEAYRAAVDADPKSAQIHSNLLLTMLSDPTVGPDTIFAEAGRWAGLHAAWVPTTARPSKELQRIGFVSGDLRTHPVGLFLTPLVSHLTGLEVFLYSNHSQTDSVSQQLRESATAWRGIKGSPVADVCRMVQEDEIDVLIDLGGHTSGGRLDVFSKCAAPVQISWLGYSGTTGLGQFDAVLGDAIVTPWEHEAYFSEPVYRLQDCFLCSYNRPEIQAAPTEKRYTFGAFNAATKLNELILGMWGTILANLPQANLLIKTRFADDFNLQSRILKSLVANGADEAQVEFQGTTSKEDHWAAVRSVGIALDTVPYSGATTTLDCLWADVPVLTLLGDRYAGRMSASILTTAGLTDWVSDSIEGYIERAIAAATAANSPSVLQNLTASPLVDSARFARGFESTIHEVWNAKAARAA